jgi:hypothetical protein
MEPIEPSEPIERAATGTTTAAEPTEVEMSGLLRRRGYEPLESEGPSEPIVLPPADWCCEICNSLIFVFLLLGVATFLTGLIIGISSGRNGPLCTDECCGDTCCGFCEYCNFTTPENTCAPTLTVARARAWQRRGEEGATR